MRSLICVVVVMAVAIVASASPALAAPGDLRLVSATATGAASDGEALVPSLSGDGSRVAFFSTATNLHPADADDGPDVYVKDVRTGEGILASRTAGGAKASGESRQPAISADGTRVAFFSTATNLHPSGAAGVYVKDVGTGAVRLASATAAGVPANHGVSGIALSRDGSTVAFSTAATNLDPRDPFADFDVYVKDLDSGRLTLASLSAAGEKRLGLFGSSGASLSADGTRVAFHSDVPGLHPADGDGAADVYVRDLVTGQLVLASTNDLGVKGNQQSAGPSLSGDGRKVSFTSYATNLDPALTVNGLNAIFLKDLATGDLSLVSRNAAGDLILFGVSTPSMSADATRIAFTSPSTNAHPADADHLSDVFVKDLATQHVFLASTSTAGIKGNGDSYPAALSADGTTAAFRSGATNLDPVDTDSASDVYAKQLGDAPQVPGDRADLSIVQTDAPDPVLAGQRLRYDLRVRNDGPATATGVVVNEELDAGVRFETASAGCDASAGVARCALGHAGGRRDRHDRDRGDADGTGNDRRPRHRARQRGRRRRGRQQLARADPRQSGRRPFDAVDRLARPRPGAKPPRLSRRGRQRRAVDRRHGRGRGHGTRRHARALDRRAGRVLPGHLARRALLVLRRRAGAAGGGHGRGSPEAHRPADGIGGGHLARHGRSRPGQQPRHRVDERDPLTAMRPRCRR